MLDGFSRRLREERIRSGVNQTEFAAWGGAKKSSQINYEASKTPPSVDYLIRLEAHGVDIGYIMTGHRTDGSLSFEQQLLFELFGKLSAREREAVMGLIMSLAGQVTSTAEIGAQAREARSALHEKPLGFRGPAADD